MISVLVLFYVQYLGPCQRRLFRPSWLPTYSRAWEATTGAVECSFGGGGAAAGSSDSFSSHETSVEVLRHCPYWRTTPTF